MLRMKMTTAATHWGIDPETGRLRKLNDEKLAESMWKRIRKMRGLPEDMPYQLRTQKDLLSNNMTWTEKTCDSLWRKIYSERGLSKTDPLEVKIKREKDFIVQLEKESHQEDLSEFERERARKMLMKMMNPDDDKEETFISTSLMARMDRRGRLLKRKADEGDEEAAKDLAKLATSPTLS